ncbi:MAG: hypothetical protein WCY87_07300 [Candidatus Cloacimonadales bacterium]|jgi:hypothetical protein|nr:hypothetical protein [Candidatus Cloacimonadota bacterium]MDY0381846.1 hypothetical protein [Candidatus Cloacimonadaceae bacterium]MCB5256611.1 hypothetical protein [Candidatus Cloacimonadota bacterium]MCB5263729.1 hypothetical protein [Candidatus Cloacimonadota bacterium]MCB5276396.1 hypothetical protein [Candidatus Cloacimonadota bacterium]
MYMILHLYSDKYLDDMILALSEAGIEDPIVLSGETLGQKMLYDIPLFASFKDSPDIRQGFGSVIMGVAEKEDVDFALAELTESGLDLLKMGMVKVFLIPIGEIIG